MNDDPQSNPTPDAPALDAIVMYWRPGCGFCALLHQRLKRSGIPFVRRNIWDNPDDAAVVRSIADGNETVPTIVVGNFGMVNPGMKQIRAAVAEHAPHLLDRAAEADPDPD